MMGDCDELLLGMNIPVCSSAVASNLPFVNLARDIDNNLKKNDMVENNSNNQDISISQLLNCNNSTSNNDNVDESYSDDSITLQAPKSLSKRHKSGCAGRPRSGQHNENSIKNISRNKDSSTYHKRRKSNNAAVRRFREREKQDRESKEEYIKTLERGNTLLRDTIMKLSEKADKIRNMILLSSKPNMDL